MVFMILALMVELGLLLEMRRRLQGFNAPEVLCWFFFLSQIVYLNGDTFFPSSIDETPWATFSFIDHPEKLFYYYCSFFLILYGSTVGYRKISASRKDFSKIIKQISDQIGKFEIPAMLVVGVGLGVQLLTLRWDVAWFNHEYLLMNSADGYRTSQKIGLLIESVAVNSVYISAIFLARRISVKGTGQPYFWLACYLWIFAFQLASSSRGAAAAIAILLIFVAVISEKRRTFLLLFLGLALVDAYASALSARSFGNLGLSQIPNNLLLPFTSQAGLSVTELIGNFFTGAFVTGDGLAYSPSFSPTFKMLSLSPFPSFIDGFTNHIDETAMLSPFVPMSSFAEVVHYGFVYFCVFWGAVFVTSRKLISARVKLGLFYYFACAFEALSIIEASTYPTRNTFRQIIYLYFIAIAIVEVVNSREEKKRELALRN
jgi:hypothetical protein